MRARDLKGFNDAITDTFDILRISRRQKLVGSAAVLGNVITNDYDLNEMFEENRTDKMDSLTKLYFMFLWKFEKIYNTPTLWMIDFKCGEYNNEPIRWNMEDLGRGYKIHRDKKIIFVDCLTQKDTKTKIDVVLLLNNRFVEISELYYIRVNGKSNFNDANFKIQNVVRELSQDMNELISEKNYFKALKREYRILSILKRDTDRQQMLTELFNGKYGYLYYAISQLNTLVSMKEQTFKCVDEEIFLHVQQNIKDDISRVLNYGYASKQLDKKISVNVIEGIISYLTEYLNYRIKKYIVGIV
jgi:hypothetical protein